MMHCATFRLVVLLNIAYFGIEFAVAVAIGSVSLFADSIDFLEILSINFLIIRGASVDGPNRARVGMALAGILLVPGLATLWTAWQKFNIPAPPGTGCPNTHRAGGAPSQLVLRVDARPPPPPQRQPHAGGVPVGAQ